VRGQHGATLVELLVSMAVTSAILVGLAGVSGVAQRVIEPWMQRSLDAQSANRLGDWLDRDSRVYVPCGSGATLAFCTPHDSLAAVIYRMDGSNLVRSAGDATATIVRGTTVTFGVQCRRSSAVDSGVITTSTGLAVRFRAPQGSCPYA
jgi:hypothetical protein